MILRYPATFCAKPAAVRLISRGVSVYEGNVYVATLDGRLVAINAGNGERV